MIQQQQQQYIPVCSDTIRYDTMAQQEVIIMISTTNINNQYQS
jgi:hypothetical protein